LVPIRIAHEKKVLKPVYGRLIVEELLDLVVKIGDGVGR